VSQAGDDAEYVPTTARWEWQPVMTTDLTKRHCMPCHGGVPPLGADEILPLAKQVPEWEVVSQHHLCRGFAFADFAGALRFVNRVGEVAETEGHHPDIYLAWGKVRIELWTHQVDGLTESDFILAAKIDALPRD